MHDASNRRGLGVLHEEHRLLGARFDEEGTPLGYGSGTTSAKDLVSSTVLCDLSHTQTLVFGGAPAESYAEAVFAGEKLAPGHCSFETVLTGDGSLASFPLLMRTGSQEYVVFDSSRRSEILSGWMSFVAAIEQQGYAPYAELKVDDATGTHCVMLLAGADADRVLGDYLSPGVSLPAKGSVASCDLDAFPCVVSRAWQSEQYGSAYLVFVPPACAVPLWRSFLSFPEVTPVGIDDLRMIGKSVLPWTRFLDSADAVRIDAKALADEGLLREESDFIGARGLDRQGSDIS